MTTVWAAKHISVSIDRTPEDVYEFVITPDHFPKWLTSFCLSIQLVEEEWIIETEEGPMGIRFCERNEYGVLDHVVTLASGEQILNPMRVVPNGSGSEVLFTLYKRPQQSEEQFLLDAANVESDLRMLKQVLEG
ncbi:SRPBCC family protein [Brevibacillus migulae]|uniref:SRPBCC family protein n=1 Tax=Brevibacillus migulae TaxID=1644114 RepID=UPI00196AA982|nr:SRPBCC family protein [Brevibacillus migulae]